MALTLIRHISIIGAKLKKLLPEGSVDKLEDLEDHYERALQMRVRLSLSVIVGDCTNVSDR